MTAQSEKESERKKAQKEAEEEERIEAMKRQMRQIKERAERAKHQSTEFTKLQLKVIRNSQMKKEALSTPTPDAEGNFYISHDSEQRSPFDIQSSPSPVNRR